MNARLTLVVAVAVQLSLVLSLPAPAKGDIDRSVLPIVEPEYEAITELDARKAPPPQQRSVRPMEIEPGGSRNRIAGGRRYLGPPVIVAESKLPGATAYRLRPFEDPSSAVRWELP